MMPPPSLQANLQGVHRPAHAGPLAARKLSTGPHHGTRNPRLPDSLQPHHPRLRLSGHLRRHDLTSELPERGAQTNGQDVSELRQRHSGILRKRKQIYWQNGQAPEMRTFTNKFPQPRWSVCPFWTFLKKKKKKKRWIFALIDEYCPFKNVCVCKCSHGRIPIFVFESMMTFDLSRRLSCQHPWRARAHPTENAARPCEIAKIAGGGNHKTCTLLTTGGGGE